MRPERQFVRLCLFTEFGSLPDTSVNEVLYVVPGLQIGLLNYAENNPGGLQILPLFNAHF